MRDNSTLPLGTMLYGAMVVVINVKCEMLEMQNRQWLAFAALAISVGGYVVWNVLIMFLHRSKTTTIFYVDHGLEQWGRDQSWWAALLVLATIPVLADVMYKVLRFMWAPLDDDMFRVFEKDLGMRRLFEERAWAYLRQGWTMEREPSTVWARVAHWWRAPDPLQQSALQRKRAGTNPSPGEAPPGAGGRAVHRLDVEVLPSGKRVTRSWWQREPEESIDEILERRMREQV